MSAFPPVVTPYLPLIAVHIAGGSLGILTGYAAVSVAKGERLHRVFGTVFTGAMAVMAGMAFYLATQFVGRLPGQIGNMGAGVFALYLVTTAWLAAKRTDGRIGAIEKAGALTAFALSLVYLRWGLMASASPKHAFDGYPATLYYVFGGIAFFMAALDFRVILRGGITGAARIARHLWRMCFAFFFAAGSFFLGQQKVMPVWMHGSWVLTGLATAPLAFLVFWMIRVRLTKWWREDAPAGKSPARALEVMGSSPA